MEHRDVVVAQASRLLAEQDAAELGNVLTPEMPLVDGASDVAVVARLLPRLAEDGAG